MNLISLIIFFLSKLMMDPKIMENMINKQIHFSNNSIDSPKKNGKIRIVIVDPVTGKQQTSDFNEQAKKERKQ